MRQEQLRKGRLDGGGDVRQRLLQKADSLFYQLGIHIVGIERLIGEAGVAKASLYSHFPSKDALVAAYLERQHGRVRDRIEAVTHDPDLSPRDRILRLFDVHAAWIEEAGFRGCPFVNGAVELSAPDHPALVVIARHRTWLHETLATLVREAALPAPQLLAGALTVLLDGAAAAALVDGDPGAAADARWAAARLLA